MAREHVAVESDGQRKHADDHREELEEPDDRRHGTRHAGGAQRLHVAEEAEGLQAVDVEVHKRDGGQSPGAGNGASGRLEAGNETQDVADENEEEDRRQEGHVLLESMADHVFGHIASHELVAVLHHVAELVGRDDLQLLRRSQHHEQYHDKGDEQPDDILGDIPAADAEHRVRLEVRRETLGLLYELAQSFFHFALPSLIRVLTYLSPRLKMPFR